MRARVWPAAALTPGAGAGSKGRPPRLPGPGLGVLPRAHQGPSTWVGAGLQSDQGPRETLRAEHPGPSVVPPPPGPPPVCHLSSEAGGLTGSSRSSPEAWGLLPGAGVNGGRPPTALPRTQAEGALRGQCVGLAKAPRPPSDVREGRLHRHTSPGWGGSGAQAGPRPGSQKQRVTKSQAAA